MYANRTSQEVRQGLARLTSPPLLEAKPSHRRIPISRANHVRGWHPIRPGHGAVAFESKLESRFLTLVALLAPDLTVQSQPVTITYLLDGCRRRYTPDFLVQMPLVPEILGPLGFGLQTYVEIKPLARAQSLGIDWLMRLAALRSLGPAVTIVTDEDLAQLADKGAA